MISNSRTALLARVLAAALAAAAGGAAGSPLAAWRSAPPALPPIEFSTFTLDNGLDVVVHEDHSTPIVAVVVSYGVGGIREPADRSGFAHLFEHLMFEETEHIERGEMHQLFANAGGYTNGSTSSEWTIYVDALPSNRLDLAFWVEAERMARLRVTEENLRREREVVQEEGRQRSGGRADARSPERVLDTLATDYAPYDRVSSSDDLNTATVADVREFYRRYYSPSNATITVAGDVTAADVRALAQKYFGGIPRGPEVPPLPPPSPTPRTTGERRTTLPDERARTPRLTRAYNIPPRRHEDSYALALISSIMDGSAASRLHQRLVTGQQVATRVSSSASGDGYGPGLFTVAAVAAQGVTVERLEALVEEELQRLKTDGVTPQELARAKNQLRATTVTRWRQTVLDKALELQNACLVYGDVAAVNTKIDKAMAVTVDDIRRVARTYLVPENRTVVIAMPAAPPDERR